MAQGTKTQIVSHACVIPSWTSEQTVGVMFDFSALISYVCHNNLSTSFAERLSLQRQLNISLVELFEMVLLVL